MTGKIPPAAIQHLIDQTNIVDLIDSYVPLKKFGANYKACCPFHEEKTPSFVVSPQKQIYHCFGCSAGGNAISFVMNYEHVNFVEALHALAKRLGIPLPESEVITKKPKPDDDLYQAMNAASSFYQQQLRIHTIAKNYLNNRQLNNQTIERFQLGYAPNQWDSLALALKKQFSIKTLVDVGLITEKNTGQQFDRFRHRVIFPIRNRQGRCIAFGGRILDTGEPKYLNSPETPLFHKSNELYGLYELLQVNKQPDYIIIVEGYMDVIALYQHGITSVVGTLGTATTAQHLHILTRYTSKLIFCFDGDSAGQKAAVKALDVSLPLMNSQLSLRFAFLPEDQDPDSFVHAHGAAAFLDTLQTALSFSEFLIKNLTQSIDISLSDDRARLVSQALTKIKQITDKQVQQLLCQELASKARVPYQSLQKGLHLSHIATAPIFQQTPSPLRKAIAILIQHPNLAIFPEQSIPKHTQGHQLLSDILTFIEHHPSISTAALLEHWRENPDFAHLERLAHLPLLMEGESLQSELLSLLSKISAENTEQRIDILMDKAQKKQLSPEERKELNNLLKERAV